MGMEWVLLSDNMARYLYERVEMGDVIHFSWDIKRKSPVVTSLRIRSDIILSNDTYGVIGSIIWTKYGGASIIWSSHEISIPSLWSSSESSSAITGSIHRLLISSVYMADGPPMVALLADLLMRHQTLRRQLYDHAELCGLMIFSWRAPIAICVPTATPMLNLDWWLLCGGRCLDETPNHSSYGLYGYAGKTSSVASWGADRICGW